MWKVRDIMQAHVVRTGPQATVRELIQLLAQEQISGVPVVDASGEIMGVVSATDILQLAARTVETPVGNAPWDREDFEEDEESSEYFRSADAPFRFEDADAGAFGVPELAEYHVEDIMTPAAFTVDPHTTVPELARFMLNGRIHRVLVIDRGKLAGIVTTFDVLRAAAENMMGPVGAEVMV